MMRASDDAVTRNASGSWRNRELAETGFRFDQSPAHRCALDTTWLQLHNGFAFDIPKLKVTCAGRARGHAVKHPDSDTPPWSNQDLSS
jgi:hypothetical protein